MENFVEKFQHLKHFNLKEIKSTTGDFDNSKVIGEGGFGKVYEGQIKVAIKRLDINSGQGIPEFLKEILMLSRYKHENLISLMGFCDEGGEKILVYEHASHGSLDCHLSSMTLTWTQRLKICLGAARGLCFLHDPKETRERLIHRDIKSSNILVDECWNAKLSDMGLSQIGPANQSNTFLATSVAGTIWYIDPMYMQTSILTKESDVYSFGVVLFEVLCGSLCYEANNEGQFQSLVRRWKKSYKEGKLDDIIFHTLKQGVDRRSIETFVEIAYQCLQKSRAERPKMAHVVEKLEIAIQFDEMANGGNTVQHEVVLKDRDVDMLTDTYWEQKLPNDWEEILKLSDSLQWTAKKELYSIFCKGFPINNDKEWFSLATNGKKCHMPSAKLVITYKKKNFEDWSLADFKKEQTFRYLPDLSFSEVAFGDDVELFTIQCESNMLSPETAYAAYLVFKLQENHSRFEPPVQVHVPSNSNGVDDKWYIYLLAPQAPLLTGNFQKKRIPQQRSDGWMEVALYEFHTDSACTTPAKFLMFFGWNYHDLESFEGLIVQAIEFKPI